MKRLIWLLPLVLSATLAVAQATGPYGVFGGPIPSASLPAAAPVGTVAFTTDQGEMISNGTTWVVLSANGSLAPIAGGTILGTPPGSPAAPGALSTLPAGFPVQGFDTPLNEGATGNGIANDTTPVQTCATTGACYLPPGYTFLVNTTITVPAAGQFQGGGPTSILKGSSVSGAVIQVGAHTTNCATNYPRVNIGNLQVSGSGTTAVSLLCSYESKLHNIVLSGTFSLYGFAFDSSSFCLNLDRLIIDGSLTSTTIGSTMTMSASVGGAATGTISSGNPGNGSYMVVFSDMEVRRVTVSGSTATWTGNLAAGTITTGNYGAGFFFGSGANCITANVLMSVNGTTSVPFGFEFEDVNGYGQAQAGDVFNTPVAENCQVCYFFGSVTENVVMNGLYCEQCVLPILAGEAAGNYFASGIIINGANISGPPNTATGYSKRYAVIDVQAAYSFTAHSVSFVAGDSTSVTAYPLTFAGGTQTTAPVVYGIPNAAGVMKGCAILYPGDYGTGGAPTLTASYTGGNAGSGATFTITAGTTPFNQQGVTNCVVNAGGTGYVASTGYVPVTFNGPNGANRAIIVDGFDFGWGLSGSLNISSIMAYDSVNTSGYSRSGYTLENDTGYYNPENGGNLFGSTVNHANENSNREFVSAPLCASAVPCSYIVPVVSFP